MYGDIRKTTTIELTTIVSKDKNFIYDLDDLQPTRTLK